MTAEKLRTMSEAERNKFIGKPAEGEFTGFSEEDLQKVFILQKHDDADHRRCFKKFKPEDPNKKCDAGFPKKEEEMTDRTRIQYEPKKCRDG